MVVPSKNNTVKRQSLRRRRRAPKGVGTRTHTTDTRTHTHTHTHTPQRTSGLGKKKNTENKSLFSVAPDALFVQQARFEWRCLFSKFMPRRGVVQTEGPNFSVEHFKHIRGRDPLRTDRALNACCISKKSPSRKRQYNHVPKVRYKVANGTTHTHTHTHTHTGLS